MGPRLASLALLLLALCRQVTSSAEDEAKMNDLMKKGGHLMSISMAFLAALNKNPQEGNTPDVAVRAFENGVQCAYADYNNADLIKNEVYGAATPDQAKEDLVASGIGIKCPSSDTEAAKCYCTAKKTIMYCAGLKYKATIKHARTACKDEAFAALQRAAPTLSQAFDWAKIATRRPDEAEMKAVFSGAEGSIDAITKQADAEMTKFFCEAIDPNVETALKGLFASELSYLFVENLVVAIGFAAGGQQDAKAMENACKYANDWKKTPFGECLCAGDRGITFCMYKALGLFFKETGFLTCDSAKKFVTEKKPAASAMPQLIPKNIPTSPASAVTSSLLLLPLSATAALLMLRH